MYSDRNVIEASGFDADSTAVDSLMRRNVGMSISAAHALEHSDDETVLTSDDL